MKLLRGISARAVIIGAIGLGAATTVGIDLYLFAGLLPNELPRRVPAYVVLLPEVASVATIQLIRHPSLPRRIGVSLVIAILAALASLVVHTMLTCGLFNGCN
jgi:hypothetical protein